MSPVLALAKTPENTDAKLWRYMDFAKFVSLLDTQSLFFSRSDLLGDSFEFTYPKGNYDDLDGTPLSKNNEFFLWATSIYGKQTFVSCWHMNEAESNLMWNYYSEQNAGIAIQTTYNRFLNSLQNCDYRNRLDIGMVRYINYESEKIDFSGNILDFIFYKRNLFIHENELRAVINLPASDEPLLPYDPENIKPNDNSPAGLTVPIKFEELVEKIYISPEAPSWYSQLVESIIKKFGITCPVVQSSLSDVPLK